MFNFQDLKYLVDCDDMISPDGFSGEARELVLELARLQKLKDEIRKKINSAAALEGESLRQVFAKTPMVPSDQVFRGIRVSRKHIPEELFESEDCILPNIFSITYSCDTNEMILDVRGQSEPSKANIEYASAIFPQRLLNYLLSLRTWCKENLINVVIFEDSLMTTDGFPLFDFDPASHTPI